MFDLERSFYDEEFIAPADEAYRWYAQHPHSVVAALQEDRVMGFINLFPLRHELYSTICAGRFNDADLMADDIVSLDTLLNSDESFDMFLSCIAVDRQCRAQGLTRELVQAATKIYLPFMDKLESIVIDTVTDDGFRFAKRLGFGFLCDSDHDTRVLGQTFSEFVNRVFNEQAE